MSCDPLTLVLSCRRVQGACKVDYSNMTSWCKVEATLSSPKALLKPSSDPNDATLRRQAPPFTVASLSLKTIVNPSTHQHEVVAAGGLGTHSFTRLMLDHLKYL